jgi:hypothetical protein
MDQDGPLDQLSEWAWVSACGTGVVVRGNAKRLRDAVEDTDEGRKGVRLTRETNLARRTDFDRHDELSIAPLFRNNDPRFVSLVQVASGFFVACLNGTSDLLRALAMLDGI